MKTGSERKTAPGFRAAALRQLVDGARSVPEMSPETLANRVGRARKGQVPVKRGQGR